MSETEENVYEMHWIAKAFFASISAFSIYVLLSAPRDDPSVYSWLLISSLIGFFTAGSIHFFVYRVYLNREELYVKRLIWDKSVKYEEISTIDLSNLIYLLNIHRKSEAWPAFTVMGGIKNKRDLMAKIVARAPDEAEIIDPYGRLSELEER